MGKAKRGVWIDLLRIWWAVWLGAMAKLGGVLFRGSR